ncbi:MAG: hypothetical protein PHU06_08280 [Gallionella sp.]|nr:hypothetical protein [Gallionella sp.]MDD4958964.1 hypothetical protein [Gallionella sp.]
MFSPFFFSTSIIFANGHTRNLLGVNMRADFWILSHFYNSPLSFVYILSPKAKHSVNDCGEKHASHGDIPAMIVSTPRHESPRFLFAHKSGVARMR